MPKQIKASETRSIIALSVPVTITAGEKTGESSGPAKFNVVAYAGSPMKLKGWDKPVVIDIEGMQFADNLTANLDHDASQRVGHVTAATKHDGQVLLAGIASAVSRAKDEVVASGANGYPWKASVEAEPLKIVEIAAGKKLKANGQEYIAGKAGLYYVSESMLNGFGFVTRGADSKTEVTIAASAAHTKGNVMKAECTAWIENDLGLVVAELSDDQITKLEANFEGRNPKPTKKKQKLDEGIEAKQEEFTRQEGITETALNACDRRPYDIDAIKELAQQAIDAKWSVDKFRMELLEASLPPAHTVFRTRKDERITNRVLEAAIYQAGNLCDDKELIDQHRFTDQELQAAHDQFKGRIGLKQLFMIAAQSNGYHGTSFDLTLEVQRAAFGMTGPQQIRASGFSGLNIANVLAATANKFLHEGWMAVDLTCLAIASRRSVSNFQQITTVSLTGDLQYLKVGNDGEIKHGTLSDLTYTNQVDTYARMLAITRKDMINDDLGALTAVPRRLGRGAALKLNDIFWTEFLLQVSTNFFASGNININTGVADMTLGGLEATETIFMNQTDPDGKPVGLMPKIILVPTALKAKAKALCSADSNNVLITGASSTFSAVNVFAGRFMVESSPYISNSSYTGYTSTGWWMLADPGESAVIEIAGLNGRIEPIVETADAEFNTLGVQMRGYSDVGVNQQEYRAGVYADGGSS